MEVKSICLGLKKCMRGQHFGLFVCAVKILAILCVGQILAISGGQNFGHFLYEGVKTKI